MVHDTNAEEVRRSVAPLPPMQAGSVSLLYIDVLNRKAVKWGVIALWVVATIVCCFWAGRLPGRTTLKWNPPKDSQAAGDRDTFQSVLPQHVGPEFYVIAVEWEDLDLSADITQVNIPFADLGMPDYTYDGVTHRNAGTRDFTEAFRQRIYHNWCNVSAAATAAQVAALLVPSCAAGPYGNRITSYTAYWQVSNYDPAAAAPMKAADWKYNGRSTLFTITFQNTNLPGLADMESEFSDYLQEVLDDMGPAFFTPLRMKAQVFSMGTAISDILDTVVIDLLLADGIAIPLSLIFAMIVLRNIRLMVLPLMAILCTTIISMALVAEVTEYVMTNVIVTPVMISLVVGLPVGHCLFLLNRFREALLEGEECKEAVERMLSTAGTTITLSQLTLSLCALVIAFVDVDQVEGLGWAMFVSVIVAFLSAVLLVPAVLLTFPEFFEAATKRTALFGKGRETVALATRMGTRYGSGDERSSLAPQINKDLEDTLWHRYAAVTQMATFQNALIVLLMIVLVIPFGVVLLNGTDVNDSVAVYLPRRDSFTVTADRLFAQYGKGTINSVKFLALPKSGEAFQLQSTGTPNSEWSYLSGELVTRLNASKAFEEKGCAGSYFYVNQSLDEAATSICTNYFFAYVAYLTGQGPDPGPDPADTMEWRYNCKWRGALTAAYGAGVVPLATSLNMSAAFITCATDVDPMSEDGREMIKAFREIQAEFKNDPAKPNVYAMGSPVNSRDAVQRVSDAWSWMSPVFVLIGFLVLLAGTRSVLVGLRAVFTTFLTIVFALGFTSLTYCHGALDWTGISALQTFRTREGSEGAVHYFVFVITVPLLIGLSMCHELFLISTAHDWYHYHKLTTKEATKMALIGTGWMNIVSGFILAVSFVGHMLSRLPILNQISFAMFWALLFDVLIVRTMLVPTLMAPCGKYNWWPAMDRYTKYAEAEDIDAQTLSPKFETPNPAV
eukprot:TRINITY_DN452_c0_g1_i7.p1 TRINITY_DN452_c0_g1~~TRINITY_DN452_c0_g1_i7.p1  ORF type:complete len:954 (+),score=322.23 TRINITY_DN452_c0_g1_i7:41-2902(+)